MASKRWTPIKVDTVSEPMDDFAGGACRQVICVCAAGFDFFDLNVGAANRVTHSLLAILDFLGDRHLSDHAGLDPTTIAEHVSYLGGLLPNAGLEIIEQQLKALVSRDAEALGVGFLVGLAIALWSANGGIKTVFDAMNVAYEEEEKRGFLILNLLSPPFTVGVLLIGIVMILAVGIVPAVPAVLHLDAWAEFCSPSPAARFSCSDLRCRNFPLVYRFDRSRELARWLFLSRGAAFATSSGERPGCFFSVFSSEFRRLQCPLGFAWRRHWPDDVDVDLRHHLDRRGSYQR